MARKLLHALIGLVLLTACTNVLPPIAKADVGTITFSISASATGATGFAALSGQTSCQITTSGTGTGFSSTVQISPDNPVSSTSWATSGISTAITSNGVSGGTIATTNIPVPTSIRFNVTALGGGVVTFNGVCGGGSSSGGGGGGGGTVTQGSPNTLPNAWPMYFAPGGIPTSGVTMTNVTTDTSCTQISLTALSWGTGWINGSSTQQAQTIALYNSNTCTTPIWGPQALNAGANFLNLIPLSAYSSGVWVKASGSLTGTVWLFWL